MLQVNVAHVEHKHTQTHTHTPLSFVEGTLGLISVSSNTDSHNSEWTKADGAMLETSTFVAQLSKHKKEEEGSSI